MRAVPPAVLALAAGGVCACGDGERARRGMSRRAGAVFHLLFGGTCRAWDLRTRGTRRPSQLPRAASEDDLRLVGTLGLEPGQSHGEARRVGLRVLRRTRVGSAAALVLRNPPYPAGGIHGGHVSVVWNVGGAGYVVSGHPVAADASADDPRPRAVARTARALVAVAASMRRPGT